MVHPSGEGLDNTFHFELEEQGGKVTDGDA